MKRCRIDLFSIVIVLVLLPCLAWGSPATPEGKAFGKITIRYFAADKKVIPSVTQIADWNTVDIKLPDIVVENRGKGPVAVESVDAVGRQGDTTVAWTRIQKGELTETIQKFTAALKGNKATLPLAFGNIVVPARPAQDRTVKPGEGAVLLLSKAAFLHYVGHSGIETLELVVAIREGKKTRSLTYPVRLTPYECKGKYVFPLKGDLHLAFLPLSYFHHRGSQSQEFAFDVVGANQKETEFTEISTPDPKRLSDFSIWGRDILAIGDGTVAELGDQFPEDKMSDPAVFNTPGYVTKLLMELIGKIGFTNAVAGNYIVIDHRNGEFSAYAHIKEGSIRVKPGEQVKKGQVIGQVGNTGNSTAPHLHFQIMDSQDFVTANGLPIMFENVSTDPMVVGCPVKSNNLSFSDNVFFTVK